MPKYTHEQLKQIALSRSGVKKEYEKFDADYIFVLIDFEKPSITFKARIRDPELKKMLEKEYKKLEKRLKKAYGMD
jgi:hypothetical protein